MITRLFFPITALCILLLLHLLTTASGDGGNGVLPTVGAIRWDGWFAGNPYQRNLAPKRWQHRLPFYSEISSKKVVTVHSDSQQIMEAEIALAKQARLAYWAFVYYQEKSENPLDRYNYGLRRYLSSVNRRGLNFCLILQAGHLGSKDEWPATVQRLVGYFKDPCYQKVLNGRPLLYMFDAGTLERWAGSDEAARKAFGELTAAAAKAGLRAPYIVAQGFSVGESAGFATRFGLDALGAYSLPGRGDDTELPYRELAKANSDYWEDCRKSGSQVVPLVNAGWDNRPRRTTMQEAAKLHGPWYTQPTPEQLTRHLRSAIDWVKSHPRSAVADTILIYAWNESDEGGWLVPTLSQGNARILAVKRAFRLP